MLTIKEQIILNDLKAEIDLLALRAGKSIQHQQLDHHFSRVKNLQEEAPAIDEFEVLKEYGNMINTRPQFVEADIALRQMKQSRRIADELQKIQKLIKKKFK